MGDYLEKNVFVRNGPYRHREGVGGILDVMYSGLRCPLPIGPLPLVSGSYYGPIILISEAQTHVKKSLMGYAQNQPQ